MRALFVLALTTFLALQATACSDDASNSSEPTGEDEVAALLAVTPAGGATDVDPTQPVTVEFDHPIPAHMAEYAALHEGDVTGPEVPGLWSLSEDADELTFAPDQPLKAATAYTIHLGGTMVDEHGHAVDFREHGFDMGGEWAWEEMFDHMASDGMGSGHMGGGDRSGHPHMSDEWQHSNGAYGMVFGFTTAG